MNSKYIDNHLLLVGNRHKKIRNYIEIYINELDKFATPLYLQNSKELLRKHNTINNFQHLISSIIISLHAITRSINEYRSVCMTVCLSIYIKLHIILFGIHHGKSDTARKLDKCSIHIMHE